MITRLRLPDSERRLLPLRMDDLVRVGRDHDGGYVLPRRVIDAADGVLALGLFDDWSFEAELVAIRPALRVDGYDHTISRSRFAQVVLIQAIRCAVLRGSLAELGRSRATLRSYDRFFGGSRRHFARKITNRPMSEAESDLSDALERLGGDRVLVKMDIEGSEYRMIDQLIANADRIVGACIEFHDTEPLRAVFDQAVDRLLPVYAIAHVHPNNYGPVADDGLPDVLEISFVNRALVGEGATRQSLYRADLDQPNDPSRPDLAIVE